MSAGGLKIRMLQGGKGPDDIKVQIATYGGSWLTLTYTAWCLLGEIFGDNEDRIYPPEEGKEGGDMLLRAAAMAFEIGVDSDEFRDILNKRLPFVLR